MSARLPRDRSSPLTRAVITAAEPSNSSAVTSTGPRLVAKSLALAGPSPIRISARWMSRADQSFITVNPPICPSGADHGGHLQLVVEHGRAGRVRDLGAGTDDRGRVGEVEGRELVPLGRDGRAAVGPGGGDVPLEGEEVPDRRAAGAPGRAARPLRRGTGAGVRHLAAAGQHRDDVGRVRGG